MLKQIIILITTLLILFTAIPLAYPVSGDVIYLSSNGNDSNSGESWDNSVATLNTALTFVNDKGTIQVDKGIYTPSTGLNKNINIKSVHGPEETIFTNTNLESCIYVESEYTITISGICFQNCTADNGAVIRNYGNLTLNNCIINNCTSKNNGGAVNNFNELYISNCQFKDNNAYNGGVISNMATLEVINSQFTANKADAGGVIYNFNPQCYGDNAYTLFTHCNFTDNIARLGNVAYTDDCNSSAITFNYSYFNPDKPNFNFIGLITNLNQIIPLNPPVMIQTTSSTVTENTTTIPIVKESNSTNSTTSFDPLNPKLPNNTIPIASLALSSISLLTTLALFLKPYLFKTSPQPVDSGMSQQVVGNSIITYDMLEKVEFQNRNSEVSRELNDLTEKIKHNPNCCPCCTSVLYMLSLLQGGIYISSTITRIEHWGKIMEFILGPLVAAYLFIKDIYFSFKNKWR